jgi:hypothetical protein
MGKCMQFDSTKLGICGIAKIKKKTPRESVAAYCP